VKNNFFGGQVTVSGLLTGKDLAEQLKDCILGDELILPRTMLRSEGDLFLCGMTPQELSEKLGVPIRFVSNDGADFLDGILGCGGDVIGR
jgi:NifB/MoaA-like Fe-S oxidoreductase